LDWELKYLAQFEEKIFTNRNFWLYFTAILLLIVLPINTPESKFYLNNIMIIKIRGDYFFHALTFIPWAFFMFTMNKRLWMWMLLGLLFSTWTEMLQYLLPYRRFNINDLISNALGILLGMVIFLLLTQGWKQRQTTA